MKLFVYLFVTRFLRVFTVVALHGHVLIYEEESKSNLVT